MISIRRAVAVIASRNRTILHPNTLIGQSYLSTKTAAKKAVDWPKPTEIPYQVKVSNSVNLTGYVDTPVQFKANYEGKDWAATIINQIPCSHSPPLWIPVIFQGDLAHTVACHLKPNDHVHITGQLIIDSPTDNATQDNANVKVMVHSINFIEQYSQTKKQEGVAVNDSVSTKRDGDSAFCSWHNLLENRNEWWDCRSNKLSRLLSPKHPDFKRKDGTVALWLKDAPKRILSKLEGVEFDVQTTKSKYPKQCKGDESWKDLVENPDKWWDNRLNKVNEKSPDFKHKETREGLWLDNSPTWVRSKLPSPKSKPLPSPKSKQNVVTGDESWKDLVENPEKWWDNRLNKLNEKAPDFSHKETRKGLWLSSSPTWVQSKLPSPKGKKNVVTGAQQAIGNNCKWRYFV
ncbi:hypothetical protein Q3G72_019159 [Acer saccharum]|nr:hypothetical protein Q3G72_019159 [Acer saccharum]